MSAETSTLAITGVKWVAIGSVSHRAMRMLLVVILARLLTPDDFGLIAVASLVLALAARLKQLGFHGALIQRQENLEEAANAYFFFNTGLVVFTYVVILALSPVAVWFFNDERVALVINVMAIKLLAEAAGAVQRSLAVRDLDFRRQTLIELAETFVTAGIAVSLAFMGFGVWALIWGMVLGAAVAAVLWWGTTPWHPTRAWSWRVARKMFRFGVDLWAISNLSYLLESAGRFFVGRFLGVVPLGYFEFSNRVIHGPTGGLVETSNRVALPAFSREQGDLDQLGRWYVKMTGYVCLATAPIATTLLFMADQIVPVVFGPQWLTTIPLLRVLSPFVFMSPLVFAWPVYVATGNTRLLMRFTIARFLIAVPALLMAAHVSLLAVCTVESLAVCLLAPVNLYLVTRVISVRASALLRSVGQPLIAACVLGSTVLAVRGLVGDLFPAPSLRSLTIYLVPAWMTYLVAVALMQPRLFADLRRMTAVALGLRMETDH